MKTCLSLVLCAIVIAAALSPAFYTAAMIV